MHRKLRAAGGRGGSSGGHQGPSKIQVLRSKLEQANKSFEVMQEMHASEREEWEAKQKAAAEEFETTIAALRQQLEEKDSAISELQAKLSESAVSDTCVFVPPTLARRAPFSNTSCCEHRMSWRRRRRRRRMQPRSLLQVKQAALHQQRLRTHRRSTRPGPVPWTPNWQRYKC